MHRTNRRLALLCTTALLASACGGDDGQSTGATTAGMTTATSTTAPTSTTDTGTTAGPTDSDGSTMGSTDTSTDATTDPTDATDPTDPSETTGSDSDSDATTDEPTTDSTTVEPTTTDTTTDDPTTTTDPTGQDECTAVPEKLIPCDAAVDDAQLNDPDDQAGDILKAIGVGCPGNGPDTFIDIDNPKFVSFNNQQSKRPWRVAKGFGTAPSVMDPNKLLFSAREGEKFLMLSTGRLNAPNADGVVIEAANSQKNNHENFNADDDALPPPMSQAYGSNNGMGGDPGNNCDGVNDCSDSLLENWNKGDGDPNDKTWFSFDVTVPPLVYGFEFDFVFFSAEWPLFVNEDFNDMFIAWSTSEVYTGNITFIDGKPLTVTSLDNAIKNIGYDGYNDKAPELAGTGFEDRGATGWFGAQAAVNPDETITVAFAIVDMGDANLATVAIIDNWRWSCEGCIPSEIDNCEVEQIIE